MEIEIITWCHDIFSRFDLSKQNTLYNNNCPQQHPLDVPADTRKKLENLNQVDIPLYREMSECLDSGHYNFPEWSPGRFALHSYNASEATAETKKAKAAKLIANEKQKTQSR